MLSPVTAVSPWGLTAHFEAKGPGLGDAISIDRAHGCTTINPEHTAGGISAATEATGRAKGFRVAEAAAVSAV